MNMKRLLTLVAFFATLQASAQQVNPVPDYVFANRMSAGRNTVTDTAAYFSIGPRYGATRGMMPPMVVDTASFSGNKRNGLLIFSVQKNKFLYWDSVGVKWAEMAGTGGSAIAGTGTTNYIPKFTGTTTIGNSQIFDNGTSVGINLINPVSHYKAEINGRVRSRSGNFVVNYPRDSTRTFAASGNSFETGIWLEQFSDVDAGDVFLIRGRGTTSARSNVQVGDRLGAIDYRGYVDNNVQNSASISVDVNFVDTTNDLAEANFVFTQNQGNAQRTNMILKSYNGGLYIRGNTSLGDTTATERLDVWGKAKVRTIDSVTSPINILTVDVNGLIQKTSLGIRGSGTTNYVPKFTASGTIGNSLIQDNGTGIGIGGAQLDRLTIYQDQNATSTTRMRNSDAGASAYSQFVVNASGNSWGMRMGSSAANSNAFDIISDALGTPVSRMRYFANGRISVNSETDAGYQFDVTGSIRTTTTITTGAPSGGSIKPWKIGEAATVSPTSPNRTIRVEIDGTVYYIHAKTTND